MPRHGVTLVDMIITVLILGILSAVAAPRFADVTAQLRSEAVARRIAADLNYVRRIAMQKSSETSVTFTLSPPGYATTGVMHPDRPAEAYQAALANIDVNAALASVNLNAGATVYYNAYGRPLTGPSRTPLTTGSIIVSFGNRQFTVTINPSTGEATTP